MSIVEEAQKIEEKLKTARKLVAEIDELLDLKEQIERARFVNVTQLLSLGLSMSDIRELPKYHLQERKRPLYRLSDVSKYAESIKTLN